MIKEEVLILLCAFCVALCGWQGPITLFTTDEVISYHDAYSDPSTNITHIVIQIGEKGKYKYGYLALDKDNRKSDIQWFPYRRSNYGYELSITGADDGKHLYIAFRISNGTIEDLYLVESADGGANWTEPVITRSNDFNLIRYKPAVKLVYIKDIGLRLFYIKEDWPNDNYRLVMASRKIDSTSWSAESEIKIEQCTKIASTADIDVAIIPYEGGKHSLMFTTVCGSYNNLAIGESQDDGLTWTIQTKSQKDGYFYHPFIITTESNKGVAHISTTHYNMKSRFLLYEYSNGRVEEILSYIVDLCLLPILNYIKRDNLLKIILFITNTEYNRLHGPEIFSSVNVMEPWKIEKLDTNNLVKGLNYPKMIVTNGKLLLLGNERLHTLYAQAYSFD